MEEIASSFLLFKKKEEGKFWKFLYVYAFGIEESVFPNAKEVLLKENVTLNVMVYSLCLRLLVWEGLCMRKRENLWRMVHSSKFMFFFQFHEDYLLIERQISPQAFLSFKNWEIEAKVGRLCQTFCKFMCTNL